MADAAARRSQGKSAPFIAVTAPVRKNDWGIARAVLEAGYLQAVHLARAVPLVLSPVLDMDECLSHPITVERR